MIDVEALLAALRIPVARRAGTAVWVCCPLPEHNERTPSFFVRDDPGSSFHSSSHCYGCGWSGFAPQLVQKLLGLKTQREAREWLRKMPAVERPLPRSVEVAPAPAPVVAPASVARPEAVEMGQLRDWPERYRSYLEGRSVTAEQVARWGLGYVPRGADSPLADRVYLPAHDAQCRLLSYTARAVSSRARRRYREPYRSEGASPAAVFGEVWWQGLPVEHVVVTEGAFNALAVERALPEVAVAALMGSQVHPLQVLKLTRFRHVVVVTDPDAAGDKAALALTAALARYVASTRVRLPPGEDPDSLDPHDLRSLLASAL